MSAISQIGTGAASAPPSAPQRLPRRAWLFFASVVTGAVVAVAALVPRVDSTTSDWRAFTALALGAAAAHAFVVHIPRNQIFHMGLVFTVAATLLLPPELVVLLCVVQHFADWAKERYAWYIQIFNICNYTLAALSAWGAARGLHVLLAGSDDHLRLTLVACGAALVFVVVNHMVLAPMLALARNHSPRQSGLFSFDSVSADLVLALLGAGIAVFWRLDIWALPLVLSPLLLIHRALAVPQLQAEARLDAKTGLFNARQFGNEIETELSRAARFGRPLSVLMADLDLLRAINNEHGHLAGDTVLRGVANVFRAELRNYDTACRFGGEEFAVLLPETSADAALEIARRIRSGVADRAFSHEQAAHDPVRATISIGVATFPRDAASADALLHAADLALYRAKRDGRNRVSF
jgi:diguanylate cyclase (GGDEF)-like protein